MLPFRGPASRHLKGEAHRRAIQRQCLGQRVLANKRQPAAVMQRHQLAADAFGRRQQLVAAITRRPVNFYRPQFFAQTAFAMGARGYFLTDKTAFLKIDCIGGLETIFERKNTAGRHFALALRHTMFETIDVPISQRFLRQPRIGSTVKKAAQAEAVMARVLIKAAAHLFGVQVNLLALLIFRLAVHLPYGVDGEVCHIEFYIGAQFIKRQLFQQRLGALGVDIEQKTIFLDIDDEFEKQLALWRQQRRHHTSTGLRARDVLRHQILQKIDAVSTAEAQHRAVFQGSVKSAHSQHVRPWQKNFKSPCSVPKRIGNSRQGAYSLAMSPRSNLIILPPDRLDAFTATGVLAELLAFEPSRAVHLVTPKDFVPLFADAPAPLQFITYNRQRVSSLQLLGAAMGRNWHRVISLAPTRLPFLLWARHRHHYRFDSGAYSLPALFAAGKFRPPHIFTPDKLHLALPETLSPDAPLVLLALAENSRAAWDWQHYAELIWRLSDSVAALKQAHIVVLSDKGCALADALVANIPAGQITHFEDLPFAKQGGLLRRARLVIGTDRLAMRMAASQAAPLVLRLDRNDSATEGRPYGLYVGQDAVEVARYVGKYLPHHGGASGINSGTKETTIADRSAMS